MIVHRSSGRWRREPWRSFCQFAQRLKMILVQLKGLENRLPPYGAYGPDGRTDICFRLLRLVRDSGFEPSAQGSEYQCSMYLATRAHSGGLKRPKSRTDVTIAGPNAPTSPSSGPHYLENRVIIGRFLVRPA